MCGIAGFLTSGPVADDVLPAMLERLIHRGPDAQGRYASGAYRAGMRRLSINDVHGGDQPLTNEDGSIVLLYNGEIYNSPTLRTELEGRGHRFKTRCDGEVICHLWEERGEEALELLDGMFALALWVEPERRLILARDLPGEKPLYYAQLPDGIAFASEVRALSRFPGLDLSLNLQGLWDFPSLLWIPEPATTYRGVKALPRGHYLVVEDGRVGAPRPYPNRFAPPALDGTRAQAAAVTREVVEEAVRSRLLSDVPVGSFLSSGLDSSIVATIAARELDRLDTFTIGFEDVADPQHGRADEAPEAEELARRLGTRHHTIRASGDSFRGVLGDFVRYSDQPFGVTSGLGVLAVAGAARDAGIKVLLTGDGADEAFGGYSWYPHLTAPADPDPTREVGLTWNSNDASPAERVAAVSRYPAPLRAWAWHYYASEAEKRSLWAAEPFAEVASTIRHFEAYKPDPWTAKDFIDQDRAFYFPNEMLKKADRLTMARSVEGRVPFAAPRVQNLADRLTYEHLIEGERLKWVLREAFKDLLPASVVERPKHGFNVPIEHWFRGAWSDLLEATFAPGSALQRAGLLAPDALDRAQALLDGPQRMHGLTVFCYVVLNLWLEQTHAADR